MTPQTANKALDFKVRVLELAGDKSRLRILLLLRKQGCLNVSEITRELKMNLPCVSHHLQLLKDNRLVLGKRRGNNIYYRLASLNFINKLLILIK